MGTNWYAIIGLFFRLSALVFLATYIIPKQYQELLRPTTNTGLVKYRQNLLFTGITVLIVIAPGIVRMFQVLDEPPVNGLAAWSIITSNLGYLLLVFLLLRMYNAAIKINEDE